MTTCENLTFAELQKELAEFARRAGAGLEHSKEQHGTWVRECGTDELGRVAYRIANGPFVVLWTESGDSTEPDPRGWGLCRPEDIEILSDLEPKPWYGTTSQSGWSVASLLAEGNVLEIDVVRWGTAVPLDSPGVYIVALTDDPSRSDAMLPWAPIGDRALTELLQRCDDLHIDGQRPSIDDLRERIGAFWLSNQTTLYVGKAGKSIRTRVNQYYRTPLGARSPHAGGWFLKTLANLSDLFIHFGATDDPEASERLILEAFIASKPHTNREELPLPFANLQLPGGRRKRHGITGATGCGSPTGVSETSDSPAAVAVPSPRDKVTLHEELAAILKANGNRWMSTSEIAREVQRRGNYKKRDGTSNVTGFQVHGRTKNYAHLFERDGSQVRLRNKPGT